MIAIIDYKAGNLTSVQRAFDSLRVTAVITRSPSEVVKAERVVFPGVGSAAAARASIEELRLADALREVVTRGIPFLGICMGTQIIMDQSEEDGGVRGLGLLAGTVKRLAPANPMDKVPQMGWNNVAFLKPHPVFAGIGNNSEFYFVHSYYPLPASRENVLGETDYGGLLFPSIIGKDNLLATQFHPEKSGRIGLQLLNNFCQWDGKC